MEWLVLILLCNISKIARTIGYITLCKLGVYLKYVVLALYNM